jgi:hypothetical protein
MRLVNPQAGVLSAIAIGAMVSGCADRGAPSFVLFGAYFPAWMLVAGVGVLVGIGTRLALLATGLAEILPLQLFVCVTTGLTVASFTWLLWFAS